MAFQKYVSIRYWKEEALFAHLRDSIERYGDYIGALKYALDDDFVILDDIGSTPVNDWRKEIIFNTIDTRYNMQKPTVYTSNLDRFEIAGKYEPRVASRLFSSENTLIEMHAGGDLRKEGL